MKGIRLGFTITPEEMADLESLVTGVDRRPWYASWAFRIGLEQILHDGLDEATEQYWRRRDPAALLPVESRSRPSPAQVGRRDLGRRPCALNSDDLAGLRALGIAGGR